MAVNKDWIQHNHDALYAQSTLTKNYIQGKFGDFGINGVSAEWINTIFIVLWNTYSNAYLAWRDPSGRTPAIVATLLDAEKAFIPAYRQLYVGYLKNNPNVTDADLLKMGLPERSHSKPTPAPEPSTVPEAEVELPSPAVVIIHFRDSGKDKKAKPAGVHGAEIAWAVLDTAPIDWSELTNSAFDTRTPYKLSFTGEQRGRRLYFALRWENTRGVKGDWSEIYEAVIP
ncbi:hypothetical protein FACS189434_05710 [Bacteroidia bacterium]|nr:hypothetical protein FACS189434_05710 [Bacteroidia bacterium]